MSDVTDEKLVGIVLVSHSAQVAASVADLARGLAGGGRRCPSLRRAAPRAGGWAPVRS
ncbi:hypothetical protein SGLAM104S_01263 [Streptomyces glaucescens]